MDVLGILFGSGFGFPGVLLVWCMILLKESYMLLCLNVQNSNSCAILWICNLNLLRFCLYQEEEEILKLFVAVQCSSYFVPAFLKTYRVSGLCGRPTSHGLCERVLFFLFVLLVQCVNSYSLWGLHWVFWL